MKITLVQSRGIVMDPKANFFKARMRINNVDSEIFVFPEMFCSGYVSDPHKMQVDFLKKTILSDLATVSKIKGCTVICGCPMKDEDGRIYDKALVIDGDLLGEYSKINLNKNGYFDETEVFEAGDSPMIVDRQGLRMGLAVGHDLYMDGLVRYYAENEADLIICMSALLPGEIDAFLKVAQSEALKFNIPILVCNMTGNDPGTAMGGKSAFIGANGEFLETCTTGSDVREIRIDLDAYKKQTAERVIPKDPALKNGTVYEVKNVEEDLEAAKACPFFG